MIKKAIKLLLTIIWVILLASCWDYRDINKRSIVLSVGLDLVDDKIELSGEVAKLVTSPKEGGNKPQGTDIYKVLAYGNTFEEARMNYDSANPYPVFVSAIRVVVFGQDFAKMSIEPYINRIDKLPDYRKSLPIVISQVSPKKLFDKGTEKETSVGFVIEDILFHFKQRGEGLYTTLGDVVSSIEMENVGYLLPYIGIESDSIKYLGLAVMKNSKMIDVLYLKDIGGIIYLLSPNPTLTELITFDDEENDEEKDNKFSKNVYSIEAKVNRRKITTDYKNEKVSINIDLNINATLRYQYYKKDISDELVRSLETKTSEKIKSQITKSILSSQRDYECDIFGFAHYFRGSHPKIYKQLNWPEAYANADININVNTKITSFNLINPNYKKKD